MDGIEVNWRVVGCCLLAASFSLAPPVRAASMPRSGTFEGVYHRDQWGVCLFGPFHVQPRLHSKLKDYEGKRIRLVVKSAWQPRNPGPSIITNIETITELPQVSPLNVELTL